MLGQCAQFGKHLITPSNLGGDGENCSFDARTMETARSPHERIANRRDGNFLLTGLGAIRNRAGVLILLSVKIPVDWSVLGEDDGN